jgi:transposase-like protein
MEEYPKTQAEFESWFATEEACREYLVHLRWPDGFRCPKCGHDSAWSVRSTLFQCTRCGRQTSVTAGTIFQDTRSPIMTWFRAMWWVTSQKTGASALGLQQVLGLKSYQTAWTWLHKLRRAMIRPGRERLSGSVEVDETYWGAAEKKVKGRQTVRKVLIAIAVEQVGQRGLGRIRMSRIPDASADSLQPFVEESVEPGSLVHTDGWIGYDRLVARGYQHQIIFLRGSKKSPSDMLPRVHRVASLLKRWLLGTHQGAVSRTHFDYYLDEFTFRFNRRKSRYRGQLFYRLAQQAVAIEPLSYKQLTTGDHNM